MNERIKQIRKSLNMTQEEFGNQIGVSQNYIYMIEKGDRNPADRTLLDICRLFSVNEEWLRTGSGDMFVEKTKNQEIAEFLDSVFFEGEDSFKHHFALALSRMDDAGWKALEKFINDFNS